MSPGQESGVVINVLVYDGKADGSNHSAVKNGYPGFLELGK